MAKQAPTQRLIAYNTSAKVGDALAARIKDPLWFLARQWQSGEFEAENGGRPAVIAVEGREVAIDRVKRGDRLEPSPADVPLDFVVEREDEAGSSPVWKSEALESGFEVSGDQVKLVAKEYHGRNLDWYHFDFVEGSAPRAASPIIRTRIVPGTLSFRGAPDPRWWRFEEGDAYYDSPHDPEPNIFSTLLPEFSLIDVNNWFIVPLLQRAGTIREIIKLTVVDSFGVTTEVGPTTGDGETDWAMFSLSPASGAVARTREGAFLYVPNIAIDVLDNDEIEEVVFTRDEEANLVWANERLVTDDSGVQSRNGDDRGLGPPPPTAEMKRFKLRSDVPPYWIPYVPRFLAPSGELYLRRGRTIETATAARPQYQSRIVAECWKLNEAEIPRTGVRVRRTHRSARGSDGKNYFWVGRHKQTAPRTARPGLRFDYLE